MSDSVRALRERLFAETPRDRDVYHQAISGALSPGMTVLDVGCGKGLLNPYPWKDVAETRVIGLDPDPEAEENPLVDEFHLLRGSEDWTVQTGTIDLAVCRYVLEHVEDPGAFLRSLGRVLKPGGRFVFLTPSKYYPVMVVSHWLPHRLHQSILARTKKSAGNDVFPTFYRMNTKRDLRRQADEYGLRVERLEQRDYQPADYFDFHMLAFLPNLLAYGFTKLTRLDRQIGASILGIYAKPE